LTGVVDGGLAVLDSSDCMYINCIKFGATYSVFCLIQCHILLQFFYCLCSGGILK
jgi:hypothetical protein